jgi:GNAT superfamily N-acetyltransferase
VSSTAAFSDDLHALDAITRNCFRSFAGFPNAQLLDDGRIYGVMSHAPITFFNGIASTHLDERDIDAQVEAIVDIFRAQQCPFRWWLTPLTRPQGLAPVLQAHGMRHAYDAPGMTADLTTARLDVPLPEGVTIRQLTRAEELTHWVNVFMPVFSRPPEEAEIWRDVYTRFGFGDGVPWTHFVAFLGDRPVATTTSLVEGALTGIYHVATVADARGRGIGAAVTRAAMLHAREAGATRAALQSSESGLSVYRALGFVEHCELSLYDWRPGY